MSARKKGVDLGAMIDPESKPEDTGIPQRGAEPPAKGKPQPRERPPSRLDQMTIRMTSETKARIMAIAMEEGRGGRPLPIADVMELLVSQWDRTTKS
ncbi:hypothetical protein Rumeso_04193 [Rubellimicrobium mesophilum DSM 19309]|uniref:Uncharacterized protein n=1 Tax=Rubellimicrobium mesophilum DSM 19309 TaxID=442562 RepID=A0A017HIB3_9RHOB|nr:hypothetical protein [Rubellimicrobium mesophilum]EYD74257.1 hypothetical protein Rumeso_04193 [Rubellimicrobium mesophilum DSM 19309]